MKKLGLLTAIMMIVLAACSSEQTPTPELAPTSSAAQPTATQTTDEQPTDETSATAAPTEEADLPPLSEVAVDVEMIADGLTSPVALVAPDDDSGRLFVVEQTGTIRIIDPNEGLLDAPFLEVNDRMVNLSPAYDERGLLGLAFHPNYADNGRFFVYYSGPLADDAPSDWNHTGILAEYQVGDNPNQADAASERVIMTVDQPYANHNGGQLAFGSDGYLYWGLGDGGAGGDPLDAGQDPNTILGTILRLDVNGEQPYAIPEGNPFDGEDGRAEVYAYGFRNPYRFSFDDAYGLFVADVGQNAFEEVSLAQQGGNHGWRIREGLHCYAPPTNCASTGSRGEPFVDPILEYDHEVGLSVIGGYVYQGDAIPGLQGRYIFGDWSQTAARGAGQVFAATRAEDGAWSYEPLVFTSTGENRPGTYFITGFGRDTNGEVYILGDGGRGPNSGGSAVFRIVRGN